MTLEQELLDIKKKIDAAKTEKAQIEGALTQLMERLKSEFQLSSVEEAEEKLAQLKEESSKLQGEIDLGMKTLREKYKI